MRAAEIDLQRLLVAGSIPSAIAQITQSAEAEKTSADVRLEGLRSLTVARDKSATLIQTSLFANGELNQSNSDALQAWLNRQPEIYLHDYPPGSFAWGDDPKNDLAPIRQRAVADPSLKIPN